MAGLSPGTALGGVQILARVRAGAMGTLYLGRRIGPRGFARPVAIKVIHEHLANDERFLRMFSEEAKLAARIDDPHVVRVEELGEADGRHFLVMEYVHGVSLAQALAVLKGRGGIPIEIAVALGMHIAAGLHGAHEATDDDGTPLNIVHRDVSPHNVVVSYRGHVRLIDFGIAKARQQGQTQTGSLRGKLSYMPPEQARSARTVDRRADVYALGLIIWEMLTGRRYLTAPTDLALLALLKEPPNVPPSAVNANVPPALDAVVMKALAMAPEARPQTAADLQRLLGDAFPAALKVLPSDVAVVMNKVRAAATGEKMDEDTGVYVEEVRKGLTVFGKSVSDKTPIDDATVPMIRDSSGALAVVPSVIVEEDTRKQSRSGKTPQFAFPRNVGDRTVKMDSPLALPFEMPSREMLLFVAGGVMLFTSVALLVASCFARRPAAAPPAPVTAVEPTGAQPPAEQPPPAVIAPPPATVLGTAANEPAPSAVARNPTHLAGGTPTPSVLGKRINTYGLAIEAAKQGNAGDVRRLLEAKVRSGHGTLEEARLLKEACKSQGDTACRDDVVAKYPGL